jgi:hypothetical protein
MSIARLCCRSHVLLRCSSHSLPSQAKPQRLCSIFLGPFLFGHIAIDRPSHCTTATLISFVGPLSTST